jgi:hypothetical protein
MSQCDQQGVTINSIPLSQSITSFARVHAVNRFYKHLAVLSVSIVLMACLRRAYSCSSVRFYFERPFLVYVT